MFWKKIFFFEDGSRTYTSFTESVKTSSTGKHKVELKCLCLRMTSSQVALWKYINTHPKEVIRKCQIRTLKIKINLKKPLYYRQEKDFHFQETINLGF